MTRFHLPQPVDTGVLERYLAGEANPAEVDEIVRWLNATPEASQLITVLQRLHANPAADDRQHEAEQLARLRERIFARLQPYVGDRSAHVVSERAFGNESHTNNRSDGRRTPHTPSQQGAPLWAVGRWTAAKQRRLWEISVGVTAAALLAIGSWTLGDRHVRDQLSSHTWTYHTNEGQRAVVTLPDGTTALLNAGSRLWVSADFSAGHRDVHLEGEALFTVTNHAGAPFTIRVGTDQVRVLGTVFSVRRYATDDVTQVVVESGRVDVGRKVLSAGELATIDRHGAVTIHPGIDHAAALAWTRGQLVLTDVSLAAAIPDLNRRYGITVEVRDAALLRRRFSTQLDTETAAQAFEIIGALIGATVKWNDGRVILLQETRAE
jgi:ferric-dicitrate binding protein FerR (iron transport regulator)